MNPRQNFIRHEFCSTILSNINKDDFMKRTVSFLSTTLAALTFNAYSQPVVTTIDYAGDNYYGYAQTAYDDNSGGIYAIGSVSSLDIITGIEYAYAAVSSIRDYEGCGSLYSCGYDGNFSGEAFSSLTYTVSFDALSDEAAAYSGDIPYILDYSLFTFTGYSYNEEFSEREGAIPSQVRVSAGISLSGNVYDADGNYMGNFNDTAGQGVASQPLTTVSVDGMESLNYSTTDSRTIELTLTSFADIGMHIIWFYDIEAVAFADPVFTIDPTWYLADQFAITFDYGDATENSLSLLESTFPEVDPPIAPPTSVPEPTSLAMLITSLIGMGLYRKRT